MTTTSPPAGRGESYNRLVRQEELILAVTERLTEALDTAGVTKAELARRLDRTPGFVSQILRGGRNLTLRTIADIAGALSLRPSLRLARAGEVVHSVEKPRATRVWMADESWFEVVGGSAQFTQIPKHSTRDRRFAGCGSLADRCRLSA